MMQSFQIPGLQLCPEYDGCPVTWHGPSNFEPNMVHLPQQMPVWQAYPRIDKNFQPKMDERFGNNYMLLNHRDEMPQHHFSTLTETGPNSSWFPRSKSSQQHCLPLTKNVSTQLLPRRVIGNLHVIAGENAGFLGQMGPVYLYILGKQLKHTLKYASTTEIKKFMIASSQQNFILVSSDRCPSPIVIHEGVIMTETIQIMQYLSKFIGEYGDNFVNDYINDVLITKLSGWSAPLNVCINDLVEQNKTGQKKFDSTVKYIQLRDTLFHDAEAATTYWMQHKNAGVARNCADDMTSNHFYGNDIPGWKFLLASLLVDDIQVAKQLNCDQAFLEKFPSLKEIFHQVVNLPLISSFLTEHIISNTQDSQQAEYDDIAKPCNQQSGAKVNETAEHVNLRYYEPGVSSNGTYMQPKQVVLKSTPNNSERMADVNKDRFSASGPASLDDDTGKPLRSVPDLGNSARNKVGGTQLTCNEYTSAKSSMRYFDSHQQDSN